MAAANQSTHKRSTKTEVGFAAWRVGYFNAFVLLALARLVNHLGRVLLWVFLLLLANAAGFFVLVDRFFLVAPA